jgi:hypothetical protein
MIQMLRLWHRVYADFLFVLHDARNIVTKVDVGSIRCGDGTEIGRL